MRGRQNFDVHPIEYGLQITVGPLRRLRMGLGRKSNLDVRIGLGWWHRRTGVRWFYNPIPQKHDLGRGCAFRFMAAGIIPAVSLSRIFIF